MIKKVKENKHKEFMPSIGIECHVQLKTKTKLFAAVGNDARDALPNTLISHICVGMPGALPVLNRAAIELSARAALALNTEPQKSFHFERKHYFYPDLPKGYQITQYEEPLIIGGYVEIAVDGKSKQIHIERANLEEDAGKNTHPEGADYSLVDLNRAGTPLLEIVSHPQIHSGAEAKAYARELWLLMKYAGVTDGDLSQGHVRFDVNVSVSDNPNKLGTRSEIKNLNSFRSVENAVNYEIKRQTELLKKGEKVIQETRGWDEAKQKSISQRGKEEAQDYRYMPEPDIPPIELDDSFMAKIKETEPVLPSAWRRELSGYGLKESEIETILEAQIEDGEDYLGQIKSAGNDSGYAKFIANSIINITIPFQKYMKQNKAASSNYDRTKLYGDIYKLFEDGKISSNGVKTLIQKFLNPASKNLAASIEQQAEADGLIQVSDESEVERIVSDVIAENAKAAEDVKNGEAKAIGFLVGQVMAKSKGRANPQTAQQIIKKQLGVQ